MVRGIEILIFTFFLISCSKERIEFNGKQFNIVKPIFKDSCFYEFYSPSGVLEEQYRFSGDSLKNGVHKIYYPNKELKHIEQYKSGKLDGVYKSYSPKGVVGHIGNYRNGLKNGYHYIYDGLGELQFVNYNLNGENFYIKDVKNNSEQFLPFVDLSVKSYANSFDTLIVKYRLPLPDSLINNGLYFYSSITNSSLENGKYIMPADSFPITNNRFKAVAFTLKDSSRFNLSYSYIGKRKNDQYENYGIVKKKIPRPPISIQN